MTRQRAAAQLHVMRACEGRQMPRFAALLCVVPLAAAVPACAQSPHVPKYSCTTTYYGGYDPPAPRSLDNLAPDALTKLTAYLSERLGSEYAGKLRLVGGQVVDRAELVAKHPDSVNYQWRPPKYNLHFHVPVSADPEGFCASVELDDDGTVMDPLTLPDLQAFPDRGQIIAASEAVAIAERNGVPVSKAEPKLYYFPDTDTLEYEFSFVVGDDGLHITYSHFHVVGHDPSQTHRRQSEAIR